MTIMNLGKVLGKRIVVAALSLTYTGCGLQVEKQTKGSAAKGTVEKASDLNKEPTKDSTAVNLPAMASDAEDELTTNSNTSLALVLPTDLPGTADQVEVTLSFAAEKSKTVFNQVFAINGKAIKIERLEAGVYWIAVKLVNVATGQVYSRGEGEGKVEAGKQASASISMTKPGDKTGELDIVKGLPDKRNPIGSNCSKPNSIWEGGVERKVYYNTMSPWLGDECHCNQLGYSESNQHRAIKVTDIIGGGYLQIPEWRDYECGGVFTLGSGYPNGAYGQ